MTKEEVEEKESSSAACSSSSNSPSSMFSSCLSHSQRCSFSWNDSSKESCGAWPRRAGLPPSDPTVGPRFVSVAAVSSVFCCGPALISPTCLVTGFGCKLLQEFSVGGGDNTAFLLFCSFPCPNWRGLGGSGWNESGLSVFCLWWHPRTLVCAALLSTPMARGGEMRPLSRFSLFNLAVLRWTGSRWGPFAMSLWKAAGSELLRVITLACGCSLVSFFSSGFGSEALRVLANLARPWPRFRKALFGGTWSFSLWLSHDTQCLLSLFGYLFHFVDISKPMFENISINCLTSCCRTDFNLCSSSLSCSSNNSSKVFLWPPTGLERSASQAHKLHPTSVQTVIAKHNCSNAVTIPCYNRAEWFHFISSDSQRVPVMVSFICSPGVLKQLHNIALYYCVLLLMKMAHIDTQFLVIFYNFPLIWQKREKNNNTALKWNIYWNSTSFQSDKIIIIFTFCTVLGSIHLYQLPLLLLLLEK